MPRDQADLFDKYSAEQSTLTPGAVAVPQTPAHGPGPITAQAEPVKPVPSDDSKHHRPSGVRLIWRTAPAWPSSTCTHWPLASSQMRIVRSALAENAQRASGL